MTITGTTHEICPWCGKDGYHEFKTKRSIMFKKEIKNIKIIRCFYCKMSFFKPDDLPVAVCATRISLQRDYENLTKDATKP